MQRTEESKHRFEIVKCVTVLKEKEIFLYLHVQENHAVLLSHCSKIMTKILFGFLPRTLKSWHYAEEGLGVAWFSISEWHISKRLLLFLLYIVHYMRNVGVHRITYYISQNVQYHTAWNAVSHNAMCTTHLSFPA